MHTVLLVVRLTLALVFAAAAAGKLLDIPGSRRALRSFGVPQPLVRPGAIVLPVLEALVAVGLLATPSARAAAILGAILLAGFVVGIARLVREGRAPECHCFGAIHSEPVGTSTLVRNGLLLALALFSAIGGPGRSLASYDATALALIVVSVCAAGLAAGLLLVLRQAGELRQRPRRRPVGLAAGSPAPGFELPDVVSGGQRSLFAELDAGRPALLVFVSPSCGPCKAILPDLARWQRVVADDLAVMVLSTGDTEPNRELAEEHGLESLLVAPGPRVSRSYQINGTPGAVLVDADGLVATSGGSGAPAVEALLRVGLRRQGRPAPPPPAAPERFALEVSQG